MERLVDVLLERNDRSASITAVGRDDRRRAAIGDAIADAIGTESAEDNGVNRADPRAGEHRDRRLRNCRQIDDDAIAFADFVALEDVGKAADFAMQLLIGEDPFVSRLAFPNDGSLISARPL